MAVQQPWDYIAKIIALGDSGSGKSSLTIRLCEGRFVSHHDVTIGVEFGSRIVPVGPPASLSYNINNPTGFVPPAGAAPNPSKGSSNSSSAPSAPQPASSAPASHKEARGRKGNAPNSSAAKPEDRQKHMKLSLWDTAGQETYKSITRSYFRGASGALLVFDITRRGTFESVTAWLHDLRQIADDDIVVVLVGNKSDLAPASILDDNEASTTNAKHTANQRHVSRAEAEEWCRVNRVMQYIETSAKSGDNVERAFLEVAERIHQNIEAGKYDLNDKRSGVKGPAAGAGNQRTVTLKPTDKDGGKKSGFCC